MQDQKMHLWRRLKWQNKKRNRVKHALQNAQTQIKCMGILKKVDKKHRVFLCHKTPTCKSYNSF